MKSKTFAKVLGVVLVGMMTLAIVPIASALTWPTSGEWIFMKDDDLDGSAPDDVDIRDLHYYVNATHVFFSIETEADYDATDSTIGMVLDDTSLGTYNNELALAHYNDSDTAKAKGYYWDGDSWEEEMAPLADHIEINAGGFHGVNLSFKRSEMDDHFPTFSTDLADVDVVAYVTDKNTSAFDIGGYGDNAHWNNQNYPSAWVDDSSWPTYSIPEFSTLLIPIVGMIALFAIFRKYKKK